MFDFRNSFEQLQGNIYDYISPEDIYLRCIGYIPTAKKKYLSVFIQENTPSMVFRYNGTLMYKCFSSGESGDAVQMVSKIQNIPYKEAIQHIYRNYPINSIKVEYIPKTSISVNIEVVVPEVIPQSFIDYWSSYNISQFTLDFYNIKPASEVWINDKLAFTYKDSNPVIRYLVNTRYKIYQPLSEKYKWISNTRVVDIQGLKELPITGDLLIISKAFKDIAVLYECGYIAISPGSENTLIPKEIIDNLKNRFKRIIVLFDNDSAGFKGMNSYNKEYNLPFTYVPIELECKDISDISFNYDLDTVKNILRKLLIT